MKYWTSWYTSAQHDFPTEYWVTGETMDEPVMYTCCAVIEAEDEMAAYGVVAEYAPDWKPRFCEEVAQDWQPNPNRFPPHHKNRKGTEMLFEIGKSLDIEDIGLLKIVDLVLAKEAEQMDYFIGVTGDDRRFYFGFRWLISEEGDYWVGLQYLEDTELCSLLTGNLKIDSLIADDSAEIMGLIVYESGNTFLLPTSVTGVIRQQVEFSWSHTYGQSRSRGK